MIKLYIYADGYDGFTGPYRERAAVSFKHWFLWNYDKVMGEVVNFVDYRIPHDKQPKWLQSFICDRFYWLCHPDRQGHQFNWESCK